VRFKEVTCLSGRTWLEPCSVFARAKYGLWLELELSLEPCLPIMARAKLKYRSSHVRQCRILTSKISGIHQIDRLRFSNMLLALNVGLQIFDHLP
jgi:hypothetical protein